VNIPDKYLAPDKVHIFNFKIPTVFLHQALCLTTV